MLEPGGPHFITVDLEVWSREDLASLAAAVEPGGFVLHVGKIGRKFLVSIGVKSARPLTSPEQTIWALLKVVDALPPRATRLWNHAQSRVFNIGYEGGDFVTLLYERPVGSGRWYAGGRRKAGPCETTLSPELLRAVAKVNGTITTTIHPPRRQVPSRRRKRRSSAAVKRAG
jgi:hypothetical protein